MAGVIYEHSIQFPAEVAEAIKGQVNVRSTFRSTLRSTYRRHLEWGADQINDAYSDYPTIGGTVRVRQLSGTDAIEYSMVAQNPNIYFVDYDIPPHQMPPNPRVPIGNLIEWAHSLGFDTGFAYYVADKIAREGFMHPGHEGRGVIDRTLDVLEARLYEAEARAIFLWAERYGQKEIA